MRFFHRTRRANARAILIEGFRDGRGNYLTKREFSGVWLSDRPLDANEGAYGDILLRIDLRLSKKQIKKYEWIEEGKGYREFLIPAALVNKKGKIAVADEDYDEIGPQGFAALMCLERGGFRATKVWSKEEIDSIIKNSKRPNFAGRGRPPGKKKVKKPLFLGE